MDMEGPVLARDFRNFTKIHPFRLGPVRKFTGRIIPIFGLSLMKLFEILPENPKFGPFFVKFRSNI
jgi:hypothetical protein